MPRSVRPLATVMVGLALIALAVVALAHRVPAPTNAGAVPGAAALLDPASRSSPQPPSAAAASTQPTPARPGPSTGSTSQQLSYSGASSEPGPGSGSRVGQRAAPPPQATTSAAAPSVLGIPRLSVTAPVAAVGVVAGVLQVPDDPQTVGWWRASAAPGAPRGTTVLDGHIDSAASGVGALFHLGELGPGDEVTVRTAAGGLLRYTVQARRVYVKSSGLPAEIFTRTGSPRLVLISCGGPFDPAVRSYQDNIVVYATPSA